MVRFKTKCINFLFLLKIINRQGDFLNLSLNMDKLNEIKIYVYILLFLFNCIHSVNVFLDTATGGHTFYTHSLVAPL